MEILLTANRSDEEPFRIERLKKAAQIHNLSQYFDGNDNITALHDHKGQLTVTWGQTPTDIDKKMIGSIWSLMCENGDDIEHEF